MSGPSRAQSILAHDYIDRMSPDDRIIWLTVKLLEITEPAMADDLLEAASAIDRHVYAMLREQNSPSPQPSGVSP